jgi:hypothetical protein
MPSAQTVSARGLVRERRRIVDRTKSSRVRFGVRNFTSCYARRRNISQCCIRRRGCPLPPNTLLISSPVETWQRLRFGRPHTKLARRSPTHATDRTRGLPGAGAVAGTVPHGKARPRHGAHPFRKFASRAKLLGHLANLRCVASQASCLIVGHSAFLSSGRTSGSPNA